MKRLILIIALLALASPAWGETLYVRPDAAAGTYGAENGSDYTNAWNGWANISWGDGAGKVSAADTLYICGSHGVTTTPTIGANGTAGNTIYIRGDSTSEGGTLTLSSDAYFNLNKSYIQFQNLSLTQTLSTKNIIYYQDCDNVVFSGVTFTGGSNGVFLVFANLSTPDTVEILDSTFTGQSNRAVYLIANDDKTYSLSNVKMTGNTIRDGNGGIEIRSENDATNTTVNGVIITNNALSNLTGVNRIEGSGVSQAFGWSNVRIQDNTLTNAAYGFSVLGFGAAAYGTNIISGNVISGTTGPAGGVDLFYSRFVDIYDNTISDGTTATIDGNGILIDYGNENVRVYNNTIYNMTGIAAAENSGCGIMILDSNHVTAWGNEGWGNKVGVWIGDTADKVDPSPSGVSVWNNTFAGNAVTGFVIRSVVSPASDLYLSAKNNIFTGNGTGQGLLSGVAGGTSTWSNNLLYGFSENYAGVEPGSGDVLGDPLFLSPSAGNYRVLRTSPAIDAGTNDADGDGVADAAGTDLGGTAYPSNGTRDIGAYEYDYQLWSVDSKKVRGIP